MRENAMKIREKYITTIVVLLFIAYGIGHYYFNHAFQELLTRATNAYIYAYPLVLMEVTKHSMVRPDSGVGINQFTHVGVLPTPAFKDIVRPNVDTLYSFAWLDLKKEPLILSVPDTAGRYYLLELMDAWTNVCASIGKRTTGTHAQHFIIVGPHWHEKVPDGYTIIRVSTNMIFIVGRTQTNGTRDYEVVHAIQKGYVLTPLSRWKGIPDSIDSPFVTTAIGGTIQAPVDQVTAMSTEEFYTIFSQLLIDNPPSENDSAIIEQLKQLGIERGKPFDKNTHSPEILRALHQAKRYVRKQLLAKKDAIPKSNGWTMMLDIGTYGTDYITRALVARLGIAANLPQDAVYPSAFVDEQGRALEGVNKYILHFQPHEIPPVNAFWSITVYNSQSFLVNNSINRYALGDRDSLRYNADGSLDIYLQYVSPGIDKESNWLPIPRETFNLTMRLYWPKDAVLQGEWKPPAIKKINN
jgi:hypothetical protein